MWAIVGSPVWGTCSVCSVMVGVGAVAISVTFPVNHFERLQARVVESDDLIPRGGDMSWRALDR
jgi:hypothetical protein